MEFIRRYFCCLKPRNQVSRSSIVKVVSTTPVLGLKPVTFYTNPKNNKADIF